MASSLVEAMQRLHTFDEAQNDDNQHWLFTARPRKKLKLSDEEVKKQLQDDFLVPSNTFDTEWLNMLQT